jgi:hypothetical protein
MNKNEKMAFEMLIEDAKELKKNKGYISVPYLMKKLKISEKMADKVLYEVLFKSEVYEKFNATREN